MLYFTSWLKYIAVILLMLLLSTGVFIIFCLRHPPLRLWVGIQLLRFTSLPADACSYTLAGYLIQLQKQGIATNTSFQFLIKVQKDTWFYNCVQRIEASLENGETMDDALQEEVFINHAFLKSWQIGVYSQKLATALKDYMKRQEEAWIRFIKKLSVIIQCSAYTFVALMVLLVYQIMLVPLQILETM